MNESTNPAPLTGIARWEDNVKRAKDSYDIAVKALAFHENRDHSLSVEERRRMVRNINETQDVYERAVYLLRRAKVLDGHA